MSIETFGTIAAFAMVFYCFGAILVAMFLMGRDKE